jgi:uncharacterized cupin superfamily protein
MGEMMLRPDFVTNVSEVPHEDSRIQRTGEILGLVAPLASNLKHLRVEHEVLPPGRRSSSPHAHTAREEVVFVLGGTPDLWVDGHLYPLRPGDVVSFPAATGIAHTLLNNSDRDAVLLVVATMPDEDACFYPFNLGTEGVPEPLARAWRDRPRGQHPGTTTASSEAGSSVASKIEDAGEF